uniref:Uncharacterized protein n=1 Tax=viral metagenome TaxID=1070528 RepID=A0A6C0CER9_9ZZZZ
MSSKSFKTVSDIDYGNNDFKESLINNSNEEKVAPSHNYILMAIGLLFMIYILNWLNNIDKCACSHIEEGKYLKEWFTFIIIIELVWFFVVIALGINNIFTQYLSVILAISGFINFIFIIRLFMYIHKLKKNKCNCGSKFQRAFIYDVLIFELSLIAIGLFIILMSFIISFFV